MTSNKLPSYKTQKLGKGKQITAGGSRIEKIMMIRENKTDLAL